MTSTPQNSRAPQPRERRPQSVPVALRRAFIPLFAVGIALFGRPSPAELYAGLALTVLGEGVRCWAAGYLIKTKELCTAGPYAHVRNPLYVGRLLILVGVMVAAHMPHHLNLAVLAGGLAVFLVYYMPRKERIEGERLTKIHGDTYARYRASVRSLVPRLRPYADRRGRWTWETLLDNNEPLMVIGLALFFTLMVLRAGLV